MTEICSKLDEMRAKSTGDKVDGQEAIANIYKCNEL